MENKPIVLVRQNKKSVVARHTAWENAQIAKKVCIKCAKPVAPTSCRFCDEHRIAHNKYCAEKAKKDPKTANYRTKISGHRARIRLMVSLGGLMCKCCGERDYRVLSIDHREGRVSGEVSHKNRIRRGISSYDIYKIQRGELTAKDLRVLCMNCQARNEYRRGKRVVYPEVKIAVEQAGGIVGDAIPD